ncbi:cupredoxin domain-containing protein [Promicromonospora iranensis]|uniref:Plastocyanin n=1 Tax=Promicromonospora iranensis TaxID=1105144 RepID=A0ABU2CI78_9MICO|nr:hypothetical protein [Promicromonospora iranensis]MDR7381033.1 plastocyanin [Promicromonospora iranensis]
MTRAGAPTRTTARATTRPTARIAAGAASVLVAVAVMSGCAGNNVPPPTEVRLTAEGFEPVTVETSAGSEVRFVNRSERPQHLASIALDDGAAAVPPGAAPIDSGRLVAGATYAARLDVPGEYVVEARLAGTGTPALVTIQVKELP